MYRYLARPIIFQFDSEKTHEVLLNMGESMGKVAWLARSMQALCFSTEPVLVTTVANITFSNPIGLAAGFDYQAQLPSMLPGLGFGFGTVGTLTNLPYAGNLRPRLGRLVRSRSLMVNKGFKNAGIEKTLEKWQGKTFPVPVGVSIGRTNTALHTSQREAIDDILSAFQKAEASGVSFSYYELNISCPNLLSNIEFYSREHLNDLLTAVQALNLVRPIFIKMPISLSNNDTLILLEVIMSQRIAGVIFGNLQKDRAHPALLPEEVSSYPNGNFSGMACQDRSDELIALAYAKTKGKLPIIGCGGVFTALDAYRKIRLGASLIQLASALVFEGPSVPARISIDLAKLLKRDGWNSVRQAVGTENAFE